jgi:hypothetical protein
MGRAGIDSDFRQVNLKVGVQIDDVSVNGRIILKYIFDIRLEGLYPN